tara:strand:+ start:133 stop:519 length:387 start_codon:yes stop_codon:yes gene_type:complete
MQGLFIDDDARLCIISQLDTDIWSVNHAENYEDSIDGNIYTKSKSLNLEVNGRIIMTGFYDGQEKIVWNDGTKWKRLILTFDQFARFRKKPYIPLSFILLASIHTCVTHIFSYLKYTAKIMSRTKQKT